DAAVLDHVDARRPATQPEAAAAVVVLVAAATAPAADARDRDDDDAGPLDRLAEHAADGDRVEDAVEMLALVHRSFFRSRKACTAPAASSVSIERASQSWAWRIVPCQARSRQKSSCAFAYRAI